MYGTMVVIYVYVCIYMLFLKEQRYKLPKLFVFVDLSCWWKASMVESQPFPTALQYVFHCYLL